MKKLFNNSSSSKIFFFERSPFMSVEILDLLKNYEIICYNDDSVYRLLKKDWNISSHLNTELTKNLENDKAVEILLNNKQFLNKTVGDKNNDKALFFYINSMMDKLLKNIGMSMLLPTYKIQEKLGNKLYLSNICRKLQIPSNKSLVFNKSQAGLNKIYEKCRKVLGAPFILQGAMGVSGEDTFLISTKNDLRKAVKDLPANSFKTTKYIPNNIPVSVHVCILDDNIIIQGPFLQILGFSQLSSNPFQFTGNDTNQSLFDQPFINRVRNLSFQIGEHARVERYRGILGIDYLWDKNTNIIYPQELNTRLVGLTRLLTGIQKDQSIFPDILKHINAFETPSYSEKCSNLKPGNIDLSQHDYSQIIMYNNSPHNIIVSKYIQPSIYKIRSGSLHMIKQSLFVHDMKDNDILITQAAPKGKNLCSGGMLAKIILKRSAISNGSYKLKPMAIKVVDLIRNTMTHINVKS